MASIVCEYKLSLHKFTNDVLWSIACHILYYNNNNNISDRSTLTVCVGFVVAFIITLTHIRTAQNIAVAWCMDMAGMLS